MHMYNMQKDRKCHDETNFYLSFISLIVIIQILKIKNRRI